MVDIQVNKLQIFFNFKIVFPSHDIQHINHLKEIQGSPELIFNQAASQMKIDKVAMLQMKVNNLRFQSTSKHLIIYNIASDFFDSSWQLLDLAI